MPIEKNVRLPIIFLALFLSAAGLRCLADENLPLKVVICESHDRVLYHWLSNAESGTLPKNGVTVIHFDAHPDMSVPEYPTGSGWPGDIDRMLEQVSISSFQLPAVHIGLVSRIIWLKPEWSIVFPEGVYEFVLGEDPSGVLKVDHTGDYYLLMNSWSPAGRMLNTGRVDFQVLDLKHAVSDTAHLRLRKPLILDIDLDGYSTVNPSLETLLMYGFTGREIQRIKKIFLPHLQIHSDNPEKRIRDVQSLVDFISDIEYGQVTISTQNANNLELLGLETSDISYLVRVVERDTTGERIDALLNYITRYVVLPEHFASEEEIEKTTEDLISMIRSNRIDPDLITIARSVEDGFTPPEMLTTIENSLLNALRGEFANLSIQYDKNVESPGALQFK